MSSGYVYCFGFMNLNGQWPDWDHPVKVGFTEDLEQRFNTFRLQHWRDPVMHASSPGTRATEKALHYRFRHSHANREWFWFDGIQGLVKLWAEGRLAEVLDETPPLIRLRAWITRHTLSMGAASQRLGISSAQLAKILKGHEPSPKMMHRLAAATSEAVPFRAWRESRSYRQRYHEEAAAVASKNITERQQIATAFIDWTEAAS